MSAKKVSFLILLLILISTVTISAQDFSIIGMEKLETDMDARVNYARKDQNGHTCAIIKIDTPHSGFSFDTGTLAIQYVVEKTGQIWLYVMPGVRKLTMSHPTMGVVRDYRFPLTVEEATSYLLKIETKQQTTPIQTTEQISNPKRKVLFKLRDNEILKYGENNIAITSSGMHFIALTKDTIAKQEYLILDGRRRVNAIEIDAEYLDMDNFNNSIYSYRNDNGLFYFIEGTTYGPFNGKDIYAYASLGPDNEDNWVYKNCFMVRGTHYVNGKEEWFYQPYLKGQPVKKINRAVTWKYAKEVKEMAPDTAISLNSLHKVVSPNIYTYKVDGKTYNLGKSQDFNGCWGRNIAVFDNGDCLIEQFYYPEEQDRQITNYLISKGIVKKLKNEEVFNFREHKIQSKEIKQDAGLLWKSANSYFTVKYYPTSMRSLRDKTEMHLLETSGMHDFVIIDDNQYGEAPALNIWYDDKKDEFSWTALEGKELVLYTFKL